MIVFAALDLKQGDVVQLVGGDAQSERVRWPDPVAVAASWVARGFAALHVVDLDAALGVGSNLPLIEEIISAVNVPVQVGGGIRTEDSLERVIKAGAQRVIVGTRALEDRAWRSNMAREFPDRLVVAADVRANRVLTHGWTQETPLPIGDFLAELNQESIAAVLVTDVGREGKLTGVDPELFRSVCAASRHPVFAAGGVADVNDIVLLEEIGAAGVVLGMALYTGAIDIGRLPGARV